jgi:hypothetical protein
MAIRKKVKKAAVATATATKAVKATATKAKVDSANLKSTVTKTVTAQREMKYKYPAELEGDQLKMKKHRAILRNKDAAFNAQIAEATRLKKDAEVKKLENQYKAFRKENYLVP